MNDLRPLSVDDAMLQSLTDYLERQASQRGTPLKIMPDTALIDGGVIDSLSIFKLILFIEDSFGVMVEAEDIVVENFETLLALQAMILRKQARN